MAQKKKAEAQNSKAERDRLKAELSKKEMRGLYAQQPAYNDGHELAFNITKYIVMQRRAEKPLTAAGCAIACGVTRKTLWTYGNGERDQWCIQTEDRFIDQLDDEEAVIYRYLIGQEVDGGRVFLSTVMEHYNEIAAMERENRLYTRGGVADIFALKALDGWQDNSAPQGNVTNNTLILNGQSAEKALEYLGYTKQLPAGD